MIKTHTVTIDGKEYEVDVEKAVKEGFLREIPDYPLNSGDVYTSKVASSIILIRPFYEKEEFILIGSYGLRPYSNNCYQKILTKSEVIEVLKSKNRKFSHNINEKVVELIENP